jgi:hypothetical protein
VQRKAEANGDHCAYRCVAALEAACTAVTSCCGRIGFIST